MFEQNLWILDVFYSIFVLLRDDFETKFWSEEKKIDRSIDRFDVKEKKENKSANFTCRSLSFNVNDNAAFLGMDM